MHHCLNVVVGPPGRAAAVLVRAIEPTHGIPSMRDARAATGRGLRPGVADARLASGPGLVGAAFDVDRSLTGVDLCDPSAPLHLVAAEPPEPAAVVSTPRIGVGYASEPSRSAPWRLLIADSPSLSGPRLRVPPPVTPGTPHR
jgi:DNA-3-methyladenine glycosylase